MKAIPLLIPLLAVFAALVFSLPTPDLGAQDRGQSATKTSPLRASRTSLAMAISPMAPSQSHKRRKINSLARSR